MKQIGIIILGLMLSIGFPFEAFAQQTVTESSISDKTIPDGIEITSYDNRIVVENAPLNSKLEIYSVVGIRVKEIPMKQPSGEYPVDLAKGYYIVRIGDTVRKVAIR